MNIKKYKIFICATEQSGDNIGYNIINELFKSNKNLIFDGVGGDKMRPLLNNNYFSLKDFNNMGIIEILFSLKKYIQMINLLVKKILYINYDLIITIDSPDFNYPLIKKIRNKKFSNKSIHIVAPSVWAWRKYRAKQFAKIYDEILILFSFEKKYFQKYGLKTTIIGHPVYYINESKLNVNNSNNNIAFLPGSRLSEVNKLFVYFEIAYNFLLKNNPNLVIFIPTLPHLENIIKEKTLHWKMNVKILTKIDEIEYNFKFTNKALVCSGTASLEIAKRLIPQLIIYKLNYFTELIAKFFIKIQYANLINIFENKMIIPEITNSKLNKVSFLKEFISLINDDEINKKQINNVKFSLEKIKTDKPPYIVAASRIKSYLI